MFLATDFFKNTVLNLKEFYILVNTMGQVEEFTSFFSDNFSLKGEHISALWLNSSNEFCKKVCTEIQNVVRFGEPKVISFIYGYIPLHSPNQLYWQCNFYPVCEDNKVQSVLIKFEDITHFINLNTYSTIKQSLSSTVPPEINLQLKWQQERFRLLVENIKDYAIFMLDKEGFVTSWNKGAQTIKQYQAYEIIGKHFSIFYTEEARRHNHPSKELTLALENGRYEEEGWRIKKDGTLFWANVIITPIYNEDHNLLGFGKVTRDLSEQKKVEALKNEFISVMSHELRTPLTSIRGALSLLNDTTGKTWSDKEKKLLSIALTNGVRLTRLINDVLDIEKLQEGKMAFNFDHINLKSVVEEAVRLSKMYAMEYQVHLVSSSLCDAPVHVDADRIVQVLTNLISNAIKFSPTYANVEITMSRENERVIVSIIDKGPGIPEHFKDRIFQRFAQAYAATNREKDGTGLGLAISKAIIEQHQGTLNYRCEPGVGTVFYFSLPVQRVESS